MLALSNAWDIYMPFYKSISGQTRTDHRKNIAPRGKSRNSDFWLIYTPEHPHLHRSTRPIHGHAEVVVNSLDLSVCLETVGSQF
jgi:hypothetical protein